MGNLTLSLTEEEALTVRQALDCLVRNEGLPATRKVLAVDDKIVSAATPVENKETDNGNA